MAFKLKINLLIDILNPEENKKYSKSLLNLKTIFEVEKNDKFVFPEYIQDKFNELIKKEDDFKNGIALLIVEQHFYRKWTNLNSYVSITLDTKRKLNMPTSELYVELEKFYNEIFLIASFLANYYNIEIKINDKKKDEKFV